LKDAKNRDPAAVFGVLEARPEAGADINEKDPVGCTPWRTAMNWSAPKAVVERFLAHGGIDEREIIQCCILCCRKVGFARPGVGGA
jgi:ankyrin repeat protein